MSVGPPAKPSLPDFLIQQRTVDERQAIAQRKRRLARRRKITLGLGIVAAGFALFGFHLWSNAVIRPPIAAEERANAFINATFTLLINPEFHDVRTRRAALDAFAETYLPPGKRCDCGMFTVHPSWAEVESFSIAAVRYDLVDENPLRTELRVIGGTVTLTFRDGEVGTYPLSSFYPGIALINQTAEWYIYEIYPPENRDLSG